MAYFRRDINFMFSKIAEGFVGSPLKTSMKRLQNNVERLGSGCGGSPAFMYSSTILILPNFLIPTKFPVPGNSRFQ